MFGKCEHPSCGRTHRYFCFSKRSENEVRWFCSDECRQDDENQQENYSQRELPAPAGMDRDSSDCGINPRKEPRDEEWVYEAGALCDLYAGLDRPPAMGSNEPQDCMKRNSPP